MKAQEIKSIIKMNDELKTEKAILITIFIVAICTLLSCWAYAAFISAGWSGVFVLIASIFAVCAGIYIIFSIVKKML